MASSLAVRIGIGATLGGTFLGLLALDHATGTGWGAIALVTLLVAAGLREFALLAGGDGEVPARPLVLAGAGYVLLRGLGHVLDERFHLLEAPLVVLLAYRVAFGALRGAPAQRRFRGLASAALGFFYVAWLGGFALSARFHAPPGGPAVGEAAFFYLVAIAKGTDIFAFFVGKAFGRTKFIPAVSPGKTTAGFVGALLGAVLITCAFSLWTNLGALLPLPLAPGAGILLCLVVVSGDLIESFFKRSVEVKDSARLLPEFGGVLDVIDSVLAVAPAVYFLLLILERLPT